MLYHTMTNPILTKAGVRNEHITSLLIVILTVRATFFLERTQKNSCAVAASEVNSLKKEVTAMRDELHSIFKIDSGMKIPVALQAILHDTFKCHICQTAPLCPPVIFARCCKSIIGCETCIDTWYRGEDGISRNCPRCSTERALPDTMRFHGLDDFLKVITPLIEDPQQSSNTDE